MLASERRESLLGNSPVPEAVVVVGVTASDGFWTSKILMKVLLETVDLSPS